MSAAVRERSKVTVRNHPAPPRGGTVTDHPEPLCHGSIGVGQDLQSEAVLSLIVARRLHMMGDTQGPGSRLHGHAHELIASSGPGELDMCGRLS